MHIEKLLDYFNYFDFQINLTNFWSATADLKNSRSHYWVV